MFISYRRDDSRGEAGRLADALKRHFGEDRVFQDVDTAAGAHWDQQIRDAIARCSVVLVLIGPRWAGSRLEEPGDVVRLEVELALGERDVTVVPVLLDGTTMPDRHTLPESVRALGDRQAKPLRNDRWESDLTALRDDITPLVTGRAPPSATSGLPPSNLPVPITSFVGRDAELTEFRRRILDPRARLVVIGGLGGTGKTRFAKELAATLLADFDDHVYFVDLTKVPVPEQVAKSITLALNVKTGEPVLEALKELFRNQRALLLLDNFEHVIGAAETIAELVHWTPGLHVLATSQVPLNVDEQFVALEELSLDDALKLLVERAASPALSRNPSQLRPLFDDLPRSPLAIELVAPYARVMPPDDLAGMVKSWPDIRGLRSDRPERHRTMRDALSGSYNQLGASEQQLFRRLAVFRGAWTVQTAAAVLLGEPDLTMAALVESLRGKRFVQEEGEWRFAIPSTLRGFALERLGEHAAEEADVRGRHAAFFLDRAEQIRERFVGERQEEALAAFDATREDLTGALTHLCSRADTEQALRLANALGKFWWTRDYRDGWRRFEAVLQLPGLDRFPLLHARALAEAASLGIRLTLPEAAARYLEQARGLAEPDPELHADVLMQLGLVKTDIGELEAARRQFERALELTSDDHLRAEILDSLASVETAEGSYAAGSRRLDESELLYERVEDSQGLAWVEIDRALIALAEERPGDAIDHAERARATGEGKQDWQLVAWADNLLGFAHARQGAVGKARTHHAESLRRFILLGDRRPMILAIEGFADVAAAEQQWERVLRLADAADAAREEPRIPRTKPESALLEPARERARSELPDHEPKVAMSLQQAVSFARDE